MWMFVFAYAQRHNCNISTGDINYVFNKKGFMEIKNKNVLTIHAKSSFTFLTVFSRIAERIAHLSIVVACTKFSRVPTWYVLIYTNRHMVFSTLNFNNSTGAISSYYQNRNLCSLFLHKNTEDLINLSCHVALPTYRVFQLNARNSCCTQLFLFSQRHILQSFSMTSWDFENKLWWIIATLHEQAYKQWLVSPLLITFKILWRATVHDLFM